MNPSLYRPDVDGLRALAILLVVIFHAKPEALPGGFIGVDVFFVISGYLISGIILREQSRGEFSLLDFYARRCRRILPALAVVLLTTWLMGWHSLLAEPFKSLGLHMVAGATFTSNLLLWSESGYFDDSAESKPLLHLWSLGVEEQFYLFWPLLLMAAAAYRWRIHWMIGALIVTSFGLNCLRIGADPSGTFYLLPTRFWQLLIGAGLAWIQLGMPGQHPVALRWLRHDSGSAVMANLKSLSAFGVTLLAAFMLGKGQAYPGVWALVPTLCAALLISAGPQAWLSRRVFSSRLMVWIGLISYPLYLWHWPLLSIVRTVGNSEPRPLALWGTVLLAVLLAWLTYRFIEKPIQRKLPVHGDIGKVNRKPIVVGSLALLLALGGLGAWTWHRNGFESRQETFQAATAIFEQKYWEQHEFQDTLCMSHFGQWKPFFCRESGTDTSPMVALMGDSHGNSLYPGLLKSYTAQGTGLLHVGEASCPTLSDVRVFSFGSSNESCAAFAEKYLARITRDPRIHTVILVSRGPLYVQGNGFGRVERDSRTDLSSLDGSVTDRAMLFLEGYSKTIDRLEAAGKRVIFYAQVPELGFKPKVCLDLGISIFGRAREICGLPLSEVTERQTTYRKLLSQLQMRHPQMRTYEPMKKLCDTQHCYALLEGHMLYRDDDHLSLAGSDYLARDFMQWLAENP